MKKFVLILLIYLPIFINAQVMLPDSNFEQRLIDLNIDSDGVVNGQLLTSDALAATDLNLSFGNIGNLIGIE